MLMASQSRRCDAGFSMHFCRATRTAQLIFLVLGVIWIFCGTAYFIRNQRIASDPVPVRDQRWEVELVVASIAKTDVRWLKDFSAWKPRIYVVDDAVSPGVPQNKGHEAMVYLT